VLWRLDPVLSATPFRPTPPTVEEIIAVMRQTGDDRHGYLQGIDTEEIIATVHARRAPMMSASRGLRL
jgi:hypothetical protein